MIRSSNSSSAYGLSDELIIRAQVRLLALASARLPTTAPSGAKVQQPPVTDWKTTANVLESDIKRRFELGEEPLVPDAQRFTPRHARLRYGERMSSWDHVAGRPAPNDGDEFRRLRGETPRYGDPITISSLGEAALAPVAAAPESSQEGRRVLLGVSGSIAAYKACELVRRLQAEGHSVRVILTAGGAEMVGAATFEGLTGAPVLSDVFEPDPFNGLWPGESTADTYRPIGHLALAERAHLLVIAPASANLISRLAAGAADDLLTTVALVARRTLLCPAMNDRMWAHPATQANVRTLDERGVYVLPPERGRLASRGEAGAGRLARPEDIARHAALLYDLEDDV
jgi:3-polyprenyl-4-hydroxybenzoate decarboxylase